MLSIVVVCIALSMTVLIVGFVINRIIEKKSSVSATKNVDNKIDTINDLNKRLNEVVNFKSSIRK